VKVFADHTSCRPARPDVPSSKDSVRRARFAGIYKSNEPIEGGGRAAWFMHGLGDADDNDARLHKRRCHPRSTDRLGSGRRIWSFYDWTPAFGYVQSEAREESDEGRRHKQLPGCSTIDTCRRDNVALFQVAGTVEQSKHVRSPPCQVDVD